MGATTTSRPKFPCNAQAKPFFATLLRVGKSYYVNIAVYQCTPRCKSSCDELRHQAPGLQGATQTHTVHYQRVSLHCQVGQTAHAPHHSIHLVACNSQLPSPSPRSMARTSASCPNLPLPYQSQVHCD